MIGEGLLKKIFKKVTPKGKFVLLLISVVFILTNLGQAMGWYDIGSIIPALTGILFGTFLIAEGSIKLIMPKTFSKLIGMVSGLVGLIAIVMAILSFTAIAMPMFLAYISSLAVLFVVGQFFV